jgi:hypothetical protein
LLGKERRQSPLTRSALLVFAREEPVEEEAMRRSASALNTRSPSSGTRKENR